MEHFRVVVIGGGIVGCSVLDSLARLGWTDSLLLERLNLTSGSTWHAAGNCTYFGHYASLTKLYVDSVAAYLQAEAETGRNVGFHAAGSLRLAYTPEELESYKKLEPLYAQMGIDYAVLSPQEITQYHPLLNVEGLLGAAHTPTDGHVDASGATHALATAAKQRGATIRCQCPLEQIQQLPNGEWLITTAQGQIQAEHVVMATSFWGREMAEQIGLNLPLYALEHHEIITGDLPELAELDFEVPTVRDPEAPSNTRQEGKGFLCGVYEEQPVPWSVDGIPAAFKEELLVPNTERLESHLFKVIERLPAFGEAGIKQVNNGPICYTPDGCPLLGPVESHRGLWLATGFCVGIGTGGGSGRFLADWMVNGEPGFDLPMVYPSRFSNQLTRDECVAQIKATYARGYR